MKLLDKINIKTEIVAEYAFLSYTLSLGTCTEPVAANYTFMLPENAQISAVKLFYNNKLISAKVCASSHVSKLITGKDAIASVRRVNKDEYLLRLGSVGNTPTKILLTVYAPLNGNSLVIPLAKRNGICGASCHTAKIDLCIRGCLNSKVYSPTHSLEKTGYDTYSTNDISANSDFCVRIKNTRRENSAILTENIPGGEMLCRLYPPDFGKNPERKLLVIYDTSGKIPVASLPKSLDFVYRIAKDFKGKFALATQSEMLTDGFSDINDDLLSKLPEVLSTMKFRDNDSAFNDDIKSMVNDTTETILITGEYANLSQMPSVTQIVTFGDIRPPFGTHIYNNDDIEDVTAKICEYIRRHSFLKALNVSAQGSEVYVVSDDIDNGICLYLRYTGRIPASLELRYGELCVHEEISDIMIYNSFAPIGLVCAKKMSERLEDDLASCPPEKVPEIMRALENIGIKYSALNSQTVLVAPLHTQNAEVNVVIPNSSNKVSSAEYQSMFKEDESFESIKRFAYECINYLFKNIRSDYALCGDGVTDIQRRIEETIVCGLALSACGILEKYPNLIKNIQSYLANQQMHIKSETDSKNTLSETDVKASEIKFSENSDMAFKTLGVIFPHISENAFIPEDITLDTLTAAKVIYLYELRRRLRI